MKKRNLIIAAFFLFLFAIALTANAQTSNELFKIKLKSREFIPPKSLQSIKEENENTKNFIVQFDEPLNANIINELKNSGIKINGQISSTALSLFAEDKNNLNKLNNIRWIGKLEVQDKLSKAIEKLEGEIYVVANFHWASNPSDYKNEILQKGGALINNPYMSRNDLLIKIDKNLIESIAGIDGIDYIYPASENLINGEKVHKCPGVLNEFALAPEYVTQGNGWDGPGLGSANLTYHFVNGTPDVVGEEAEVAAALETWSKYVQVNWSATTTANLPQSIDISWGSAEHGDGFQFDGAGNVLAHCFYPNDTNPESIAGDLHFDEDENWKIGSDIDIYSVALHESGHGL